MNHHTSCLDQRLFNSNIDSTNAVCGLLNWTVSNDADSCAAMLKDPKIVEVRRMKLQTYLRLVVAQLSRDFPELVEHACRQTLVQTVPFFSYVSSIIFFTKYYVFTYFVDWLEK